MKQAMQRSVEMEARLERQAVEHAQQVAVGAPRAGDRGRLSPLVSSKSLRPGVRAVHGCLTCFHL